jgi:hypothetical protein
MNYPENTTRWQPGAVVIHDKDAKREEMLMQVKGYHPVTGLCITRYIHPDFMLGMKKRYLNDFRCLHDPRRFGLSTVLPAQAKEVVQSEERTAEE